MNATSSDIALTIVLPEASIARLVDALTPLATGFCPGVEKMPETNNTAVPLRASRETSIIRAARPSGKYSCEILGELLSGSTLPEVFSAAVDLMNELDPAVLEKLSVVRPSTARNYIARDKENVHAWSPHLGTLRTESGWWISKCVSHPQTVSHLQALCRVAGLEFGRDIRFPA